MVYRQARFARDAVRVSKAIDDEFANSPYETKTQTESAFAASWVKQFGNIEFLILVDRQRRVLTLLLVTGNTMAISVRERTGELAILKAIGFKDGSILFLVLAESLAIALVRRGSRAWVWPCSRFPPQRRPKRHAAHACLCRNRCWQRAWDLPCSWGRCSGLLPGIGAMRLRVVEAFRRICKSGVVSGQWLVAS